METRLFSLATFSFIFTRCVYAIASIAIAALVSPDGAHAQYAQFRKLAPSNIEGDYAYFGRSLAVSADGRVVVVGGPGDASGRGSAWMFVGPALFAPSGVKLVGSGGGTSQASSVAISSDGGTVIMGGSGGAWVFVRNGPWVQQGNKLTPPGSFDPIATVALSGNGNVALIGGADAAYIFTRSGTVWSQGARLAGSGSQAQVALSADGNTALVGNPYEGTVGAAWVYTNRNGTWGQGFKLVGSGASGSSGSYLNQGYAVALSSDGNTAMLGGPGDASMKGAVWIFARQGDGWVQQGNKLAIDGIGAAKFGHSVALTANGDFAVIGSPDAWIDGRRIGAGWIYRKFGSTWLSVDYLSAKDRQTGNATQLGSAVSVSGDGVTVFVGGEQDVSLKGSAWPYQKD